MLRSMILATAIGVMGVTAQAAETTPTISVNGTGMVAVAPDMAHITVGVVQEAITAAEAMTMMSDAMAAVMAQMTAAGIDDADMQTGSLRLDQRYENDINGSRKPAGYAAYADIQVQVVDLDMLGAVLDAAVRDGANQMNGLRFDVADKAPHLDAARRAAVADALAKAAVYSSAAGVALGDLMSISEGSSGGRPMPMMAEAAFDSARRSVPIAAGELTISASVSIVWALNE